MVEPTQKAEEIDDFIKKNLGIDRVGSIKKDICAMCRQPVTGFRDALSGKEYTISGLCQTCQDRVFAEPEDDYPDV